MSVAECLNQTSFACDIFSLQLKALQTELKMLPRDAPVNCNKLCIVLSSLDGIRRAVIVFELIKVMFHPRDKSCCKLSKLCFC